MINKLRKSINNSNFRVVKLNDVCDNIFSGGTPSTKNNEYYDGSIPWIRSGEIDFKPIYKSERNITDLGYDKSSAKWVREKSVLIAMTGATVGKTAINEIGLTTNQSCACIEVNREKLNYRFLFYYLMDIYRELVSMGQGAMSSLNLKTIKNIEIPLPPLKVQNEIVEVLDKFTELEEELEAELEARTNQYEYYQNYLLKQYEKKIKVKIDDLLDYIQPTSYIVKSTEYNDSYNIPVLTAGKSFVLGYTNETDGVFPASKENPVIIFDDFTTAIQWVDFPFKVKSSALKILVPKEDVNIRFIFYLMSNLDYKVGFGTHGRHWISKYSQQIVELPSQEEQQRIVSILDKFSSLVNDIKEGLPAEINLRRKQYEYYRNKLLTFE